MTTDSTLPVESAEGRLEQIYSRLAEAKLSSEQIAGRARDASAHAAEIRSAQHVTCHHSEQAEALTRTLEKVEHELAGLRVAMETRGVIEQAKGMLMLREGCDADTAFALLVDLSQRGHHKLIDVARTMVSAWSAGERAET